MIPVEIPTRKAVSMAASAPPEHETTPFATLLLQAIRAQSYSLNAIKPATSIITSREVSSFPTAQAKLRSARTKSLHLCA